MKLKKKTLINGKKLRVKVIKPYQLVINNTRVSSALVTDFPQISILLIHTLLHSHFHFHSHFLHASLLTWPHRHSLTRRHIISTTSNSFTAGDSTDDMFQDSKVSHLRCALVTALFFATVSLSCLILLRDADSYRFFSGFSSPYHLARLSSFFPSNDQALVSSVLSLFVYHIIFFTKSRYSILCIVIFACLLQRVIDWKVIWNLIFPGVCIWL